MQKSLKRVTRITQTLQKREITKFLDPFKFPTYLRPWWGTTDTARRPSSSVWSPSSPSTWWRL